MQTWLRFYIASAATIVGSIVGGIDESMNILITVMVIDFVMGVMIAYNVNDLSSKVMTKGFFKRAIVMLVISLAYQLSIQFNMEAIRTSAILYYVAVESLSILENVVKLDIAVPQFLKELLESLRVSANEGPKEVKDEDNKGVN